MAIGVGLILKAVLSPVISFTKSVVRLVLQHPKQAAMLLACAVVAFYGYKLAYNRGVSSQERVVSELRSQLDEQVQLAKQRNELLKAAEKQVQEDAQVAKQQLDLLKSEFQSIQAEYQKNLAAAKASTKVETKVVTVTVPGKQDTVDVEFQDGVVVCSRYPSGYAETVNAAVSKTIEVMRGGL